jgi:hypothetical protein
VINTVSGFHAGNRIFVLYARIVKIGGDTDGKWVYPPIYFARPMLLLVYSNIQHPVSLLRRRPASGLHGHDSRKWKSAGESPECTERGIDRPAGSSAARLKRPGKLFTFQYRRIVMETLQHQEGGISIATRLRWLFWSGVFFGLIYAAIV